MWQFATISGISQSARLSEELVEAARRQAKLFHRSPQQQIEERAERFLAWGGPLRARRRPSIMGWQSARRAAMVPRIAIG
jgi:hypothetical protein